MPREDSPSAPRKTFSLQLKVGLAITGAIVLLGLLAPWIAPHPWDTISMRTRFLPPSATYWFGTDEYGRDLLSRLLMGTRLSLAMGISATAVSLAYVERTSASRMKSGRPGSPARPASS